jgi:TRAP-type uncharacterized transport system fused permease subunit
MWESGFAAMRAAAPAYIVPFMFIYEPRLLLIVEDWSADWMFVAWAVTSASIGVVALAGGLFGWLLGFASMWQRAVLVVASLFLIKPGLYTDIAGLVLLAAVVGAQLVERRHGAESGVRA